MIERVKGRFVIPDLTLALAGPLPISLSPPPPPSEIPALLDGALLFCRVDDDHWQKERKERLTLAGSVSSKVNVSVRLV